jgi:prepilin-type N-terminal cleavage/methylation domain-containing protein
MRKHERKCQAGFTLIEYIITLVIVAVVAAMLYSFFGSSLIRSGEPIQRLRGASDLSRVMENIVADYNRLNALNLRYVWKSTAPYTTTSFVVPKINNGHYYKCTAAGNTGASEPAWPTNQGAVVTDGGVIWKEVGNVWKSATAYAVNDIVVPYYNNGHYYQCTTAGTSGTQPTWPLTANGTVTETGGPTWKEAGTILDSPDTTNAILKDNLKYYLTNNPARYGTGYTVVTAETKFIQFGGSPATEVNAGSSGTSSENNNLKVTIQDETSGRTMTTIFTIR